jgi:GcrA cell cycle regulator
MTHTPPYWTDERVAELKRLHEAGLSARQIGVRMGTTRNATIGKLKRLKLTLNGVPRLTEEQRAESRKKRNAARVVRKRKQRQRERGGKKMQEAKLLPPFIGSLNIPFADLRPWREHVSNQCRYIAAEPPGPDYLACGNETLPGESYCGHCGDIVFSRGQTPVTKLQEAA